MQELISFTLQGLTCQDLLHTAQFFADLEGTILLLSGGSYSSAERSFLALFPLEIVSIRSGKSDRPWEELERLLIKQEQLSDTIYPEWIGYCGYEMGAWSDPDKHLKLGQASTPDAYFQRSGLHLVFDHHTQLTHVQIDVEWFQNQTELPQSCQVPHTFFQWVKSQPKIDRTVYSHACQCLEPPPSLEDYHRKIERAKEWIYAGECYQINLSHHSLWQSSYHPFDIFSRLHALNPAPFSAYLKLFFGTVVSSSPERLLLHRSKKLETRPIKGTAARGRTAQEDQHLLNQLLTSFKEQAELMMITDLMRNDLGRVSEIGSVVVEQLKAVEAYTNVFHLYSVITSTPIPSLHPIKLLRAIFPGGSVTGCPKLRAMEAIYSLEQRARGLYTGSIGYITRGGCFDFNIAIRTLVFQQGIWMMQVGGAVIIDSSSTLEYQETMHKSRSMLQALGFALPP